MSVPEDNAEDCEGQNLEESGYGIHGNLLDKLFSALSQEESLILPQEVHMRQRRRSPFSRNAKSLPAAYPKPFLWRYDLCRDEDIAGIP